MIFARVCVLVALLLSPAGCHRDADVAVPPGCELPGAAVTWSDVVEEEVLTSVTIFDGPVGADGTAVVKTLFRPSITGIKTPDGWMSALAASLGDDTGKTVYDTPEKPLAISGVNLDPTVRQNVLYQGVHKIGASFHVACDPAVRGRFTSWTGSTAGGVVCGSAEPPRDAFGKLAGDYCGRKPRGTSQVREQ